MRSELGSYPFIREELNSNYRSQKVIVDFNNQVFSQDNLRCFFENQTQALVDEEGILEIFSAAPQNSIVADNQGLVQAEFNSFSREKLIDLTRKLCSRFKLSEIAILVRKNEQVQLISSWLLEAGIAVESDKTLDIRNNPYIKELMALMQFLNSPIDNLSFASFILGKIFSSASGVTQEQMRDFIFAVKLNSKKERVYLYREFSRTFPEIWEKYFQKLFKHVGFVPVYEMAVTIFDNFSIDKNFPQAQGFFLKFLEAIKERQQEDCGIGDFLVYLANASADQMYVEASSNEAVKILTVHKAKGLEFQAVIVPFLEIVVKPQNQLVIEENDALSLWRIKRRYADFSKRLALLYRQEYSKALLDELNNIYVCLTRAKDELYLFVPEKAEGQTNLARFLFKGEDLKLGQEVKLDLKDEKVISLSVGISEHRDWVGLLKEEFGSENELRFYHKKRSGEYAHKILSRIGNLWQKDLDQAYREACDAAMPGFSALEDKVKVEVQVKAVLSKKELQKFFISEKAQVLTEQEIVNKDGRSSRIDRLMIFPDEAWIIDYKSSEDEGDGDQKKQVIGYMDLLKGLYPEHKIRGFIIYLDSAEYRDIS